MLAVHPCLDLRDTLQRLVPACLQFAGHQAVVGVDRVELTLGTRCFIAGFFQRHLQGAPFLLVLIERTLHRLQRRFDSGRLNGLQDQIGDRAIDTQAAQGLTRG